MTDIMKFFLNPLRVINKYKGYNLNPTKSKLDIQKLSVVWKYIKGGKNLNVAYESLVDAMAQTNVLIHGSFTPYIDRGFSIQLIHDILSKIQQSVWNKEMDSTRPVYDPWEEINIDNDVTW